MRWVHEEKGLPEGTYAELVMEKGVCPLLDQDGLCALQRERGAGVLPRVCKVFPRREAARASGYYEWSLSPACEGVLALLWDHPEGGISAPNRSQRRNGYRALYRLRIFCQKISKTSALCVSTSSKTDGVPCPTGFC